MIRSLLDRLPYVGNLRKRARDVGSYPAGHFYSPIPKAEDVVAHLASLKGNHKDLPDIHLNSAKQRELLDAFQAFYGDLPFPEQNTPECRYHYNQTVFVYPDAIFLYSFLRYAKPKRIIEVGSGMSSAVILDTTERFFSHQPALTFIEPYPKSLRKILRPHDEDRVTIIEKKVQDLPLSTFTSLEAGDLLFIDSSHVLKFGSDVQFLLFNVLPQLRAGVVVHFHDIFNGFEYPDEWLLNGWYWNEGYFLRAFLAYNSAWEISFFSSYISATFKEFLVEKMPLCARDEGGSLYLRKTGG